MDDKVTRRNYVQPFVTIMNITDDYLYVTLVASFISFIQTPVLNFLNLLINFHIF